MPIKCYAGTQVCLNTKFQVPIISIIKDFITKVQLYSLWYNDQKPLTPPRSSTKPDLQVAELNDYATSPNLSFIWLTLTNI